MVRAAVIPARLVRAAAAMRLLAVGVGLLAGPPPQAAVDLVRLRLPCRQLPSVLQRELLLRSRRRQPVRVSNPDFHRVATWTSAHTAFVDDCQLGVLEAPSPSIFTVLSSFTEFNFSDLLARRVAPKHKDLKDALPVLSLLMRGLSPREGGPAPGCRPRGPLGRSWRSWSRGFKMFGVRSVVTSPLHVAPGAPSGWRLAAPVK